ncbi:IclR family transcriptional regulator [Sporosarcina aquimarina]|uniref:IclR family transcriptional regulator n=1 Tax=Sporosarcina aquimarina TaxID=114975 RepID=UPI001C8ECF8B|nr:IclR family transcriptional regulator [Sporosarcina aquimarina]MBY0223171.1 IclR family transcriptional regulator [Sporosarcina aquimarina]
MGLVQSVVRAIKILEVFDEMNKELSIKEISAKLELNKSTVHALLKTLKEFGYITQNADTADYSLGWKLYERGNLLLSQLDLKTAASSHLQTLNKATNETVHLVTRLEHEAIYIDKINGHNTLVIYSRVGKKVPLHCSAVGKVLAAYLPEASLTEILNDYEFAQATVNSIQNHNDYMAELANVRKNGYAVDDEENEYGIICFAMPIYDHRNKVVAAVSVSSPKSNFTEEKESEYLKLLKLCVDKISQELGANLNVKENYNEIH